MFLFFLILFFLQAKSYTHSGHLKKKFSATVKGCRTQNDGDMAVFVVPSSSASSPKGTATSENDGKIVNNGREDLEAFASDVLLTSLDDLDTK